MSSTVFLGADHRGFQLKEKIKPWLMSQGYQVVDCGNTVLEPQDDYPDFALAVAQKVAANPQAKGIVACGSGIGVSVAANKVAGIRASVATSAEEVTQGRQDDDLNVLALSANYLTWEETQAMIKAFLTTDYVGEARHVRRLAKISQFESQA